jgi:hypothetical protein
MLICEENRISEMELATDEMSQQFTFNLQTGSDNGISNTESVSDGEMSVAEFWIVTAKYFTPLCENCNNL